MRTYPNSRVGSRANYSGKGLTKKYLGGNLLHSVRVVCWGISFGFRSKGRLYCIPLLTASFSGYILIPFKLGIDQ